jgi:GntR family transcriptional repressor for pyruvate dehydrogenase complex
MHTHDLFAEPIIKTRLHEEIAGRIIRKIITGELKPGTRLPSERELALNLKVNRATVREAFRKLENSELIESRHGNGVYVKDFTLSSNLELIKTMIADTDGTVNTDVLLGIIQARNIMCPEMAGIAAAKTERTDILEMEHVINNTQLPVQEKDLKIHQLIARFSKNILYIILLNFFNQIYRDYCHLYFSDAKNISRTLTFHKDIFSALKDGDPLRARNVMKEILEYTEKATRANLNKIKEQSS